MTTRAAVLTIPSLDGVLSSLRADASPIIALQLALRWGEEDDLPGLRAALFDDPLIREAFSSQHADGSWGSDEHPQKRILATLWMIKALADLGVDDSHPGWHRGAEYLATVAHTESGVFGLDGRDDGVLSCYPGIAAEAYLLGGRTDLARPQIEWILRYQDVRVRGDLRRPSPADIWDERLRTRYGGCFADTTCLLGLVKNGRALQHWSEVEPDGEVSALVGAIREVFLERRLMYRTNGEIVPIGIYGGSPSRWLLPAFPLDWHTDLIEVLDFVATSGPPDTRMQPAIDALNASRLPDGTWPLLASHRPTDLPALERRSQRKGSLMITLRVAAALSTLGAPLR